MAKDARIPMRVPEALKAEFEVAAEIDGAKGVSTWLRQLGEERCEQIRTGHLPRTAAARVAANLNGDRRPEPSGAFVPGFGLEEEA